MSFTNDFKINVNKLNTEELINLLLEISHPSLDNPIRLVADNKDFLFNGNNYLAMNFAFSRQPDIQGELPKATLTIQNIGRNLVKWIDATGGGRGASVRVILARRSAPTITEEYIDFSIGSSAVTSQTIVISLIIQNNLVKRTMKYVYDKKKNVRTILI